MTIVTYFVVEFAYLENRMSTSFLRKPRLCMTLNYLACFLPDEVLDQRRCLRYNVAIGEPVDRYRPTAIDNFTILRHF